MNKPDTRFTVSGIHDGARRMLERARSGKLLHFDFVPANLAAVKERVLTCMRRDYGTPENVPWHSRWVHLEEAPAHLMPKKMDLHTQLELVTLSVLLDGGAGNAWIYSDSQSKKIYSRSEGLAAASLEWFGALQLRLDAKALQGVTLKEMGQAFQLTPDNRLEGAAQRVELLQHLGALLEKAGGKHLRLGEWLEKNLGMGHAVIGAEEFFNRLIQALHPLWGDGDIGVYSQEAGQARFVPFHKLILWLGYSLGDTLQRNGTVMQGMEKIPGLAEYRNGGLFVDAGVLQAKNKNARQTLYEVSDDFVIEWRAMTLALLQELALQLNMRMAQVLQAGTWTAGREIARERRADGIPPFRIHTKGILF